MCRPYSAISWRALIANVGEATSGRGSLSHGAFLRLLEFALAGFADCDVCDLWLASRGRQGMATRDIHLNAAATSAVTCRMSEPQIAPTI